MAVGSCPQRANRSLAHQRPPIILYGTTITRAGITTQTRALLVDHAALGARGVLIMRPTSEHQYPEPARTLGAGCLFLTMTSLVWSAPDPTIHTNGTLMKTVESDGLAMTLTLGVESKTTNTVVTVTVTNGTAFTGTWPHIYGSLFPIVLKTSNGRAVRKNERGVSVLGLRTPEERAAFGDVQPKHIGASLRIRSWGVLGHSSQTQVYPLHELYDLRAGTYSLSLSMQITMGDGKKVMLATDEVPLIVND
jgi:hypothetical protein